MGSYFWIKDFRSRPSLSAASRVLLLPLSVPAWLYGQVQALRRWSYRRGIAKSYRPGVPVISVGNVTAGGTGKTPCVEAVCRAILDEGRKPAVLSRGYGGELKGPWGMVSDGARVLLGPEEAGDEAALLASRLPGVPVLVGSDRRLTARLAVERSGAQALVLDDGFQHLRLARDLDIVTVDARDPFGNGYCFPRGLLRETPKALGDASMILLTRAPRVDQRRVASLREAVRRHNLDAPVLQTSHAPVAIVDLNQGHPLPLVHLRDLKVLAFAGIGSPDAFFQDLEALGARVLEAIPFPDHHPYGPAEVAQLENWAGLMNVQAMVTTEKDGVRLAPHLPLNQSILALRIELRIDGEGETFRRLIRSALNP
jgi:tetraacyldisaccharide 4'-kinase